MKTAILTGASSGLGKEYLTELVRQFPEVEQIVLIARRKDRLDALAAQFPQKKMVVLPLDLTQEDSYAALADWMKTEQPQVHALINNAGFGTLGNLIDMDYPTQMRMTDLNVRALTTLTTIALPYMEKGGFVLNVCSIASFCPNPRMTVYCSTKAYVLSFSKSLRYELKDRGTNVLAVCPGPMETEFLPVAGITSTNSKTFATLPYCNPAEVARKSLRQAARGRAVYTNRVFFKFYRVLAKILPHNWLMPVSKA